MAQLLEVPDALAGAHVDHSVARKREAEVDGLRIGRGVDDVAQQVAAVALAVIALLAWGAVTAMRQVWFLGVNDQGEVAIYRGLPYELPFGIDLYSEQEATGTEFSALPEDRRGVATDHEWRSEEDARSRADDLATAATGVTPSAAENTTGTGDSQSSPDDAVPGGNGGSSGGGNAGQNSPPGSSG